MTKRIISLILTLVMIFSMMPATSLTANAASEKDEINIIRLVGPKSGRYLDFECGVSLLGVKVDGIRWVDHTAGKKYEIAYPGTHEPVEVVAGHEYRVVIFMSTTDGSVFPDPDDITASIPGASSVYVTRVGDEDAGGESIAVNGYFTATQGDSDIIGVQASGDGYYWNRDGEAVLNLNMDSQAFLYDDGSIGPVEGTRMGSLYTDQALTKPATSMVMGKTYYFEYSLVHKSGEVNKVEDYYSSLDFEGFSNGTVIKTTAEGNNNFTVLCSIVYGDLNVDRVEAVGTGYGYDSEKGAYAPIFESIKAYNADGIEFDYDGFTWSTPFYTKSSFSSANKLTTEPQNGETYYFGIYIDQYLDGMSYGYTGSAELMNNSVVTIPGFDVECVGFMEREMGSYLELTYAATKKGPDVYVGGVGMYDGDYLAVGATTTQTTKPSSGYAYYKDGTLTLNNYSYEGKGYLYNSSGGWYATVYTEHDLTVELVGTNSLKQTASDSDGIRAGEPNSVDLEKLTIQGDGNLNVTSTYCGILAWGPLTVNGGTIISTATDGGGYKSSGILSERDCVIINGGNVTVSGDYGLWSHYRHCEINGGNVTATGTDRAIAYGSWFTVAEGTNIQASTTVDGELGEYVAANLASYKKIVVRSAPDVYVGGVGMYDGDYLAVGATTTQTTKPSGGYAYYKNGTLTLNNYSYEGYGYEYNSDEDYYAVIYTKNDLTLELIGNNTLTQTDSNSDVIYVAGANLTVGGDGKLTGTSEGYALYADKDITINGGTVEVSTYHTCILSYGEVIINDGDITAESERKAAIYSKYNVKINGGNVTAIGGSKAISCAPDSFYVANGLKIQASTETDGALGEYVAANHDSYKKIVITSASTVLKGDVNGDGEISVLDAMLVAQYIVGDITEAQMNTSVANVNGDSEISVLDAMLIAQYIVGDITQFPT